MKTLVIVGDFNLPDICWSTPSGTSPFSNSLCNLVYEYNLTQLVSCPTHIKDITLDLVIISAESNIHVLTASEVHPLLPTDHLTDIQHTVQSRQRSNSTYVFDYSKANFEGLCNHLLESDFSDCFILDNMENVWTKTK